ncbi:carboxypeptidase-like regulatory domain-containing protein [Tenacibaculum aquimarinum]|uniref:carboxypeptidase-like regulatory domain-containing protein n=1 Tax=Tenacibaculum aquimarinum TaxID=2910675 RepID=UPI001F0A1388|nr:carboxypeptidase-like regulatory domain-containing protein [Tenacibaculum aquimarinum]MCH3884179.1 carboxypeptidase-like regulatory domain-containing protein [Tenacibaculum aquimarinum]
MNIRFLHIIFLLCLSQSFAQTVISGKIISEKNIPLEGASVYFNNTTIGTITNKKGLFRFKIKDGNYILVVSYLGFKTHQLSIDTSKKQKEITIKLQEDNNVLDEILIKKTVYDDDWKYNLNRFKQTLLGRSKLSQECKILNEKDLHFEFNYKTNTLTAIAKKPLKIKHSGLGYLITYDLVDYTLQKNQLFFSGYARYENLRKSVKKKWKRNRQEAFNGSQMHFFRDLINNKYKENGFVVNQFKRVLNPERPSEEKIKSARELIKLNRRNINFSKTISNPTTHLDSALVTVKKARLPKYKDYLYKQNVPYEEIISFENNIPVLVFENHLMVIYTKEIEEENYLIGMFGKRKKASGVQTSNIVLQQGKAFLDRTGITVNPNALFNEGYWGFESFGNMLPLDYIKD